MGRLPRSVRLGTGLYTLLLRAMPSSFREEFGSEALADVEDLLEEARRLGVRSMVATTLRTCLDLIVRLPGAWHAAARRSPAADGNGFRSGSTGMGERSMSVMNQLRQAARTLAKKPGFTLVAVLTLALGIGANVAIFTIVDAVLLRPLPYEESERIVEIRHHAPGIGMQELRNSDGMLAFYRENAEFLEQISAFRSGSANLAGDEREAARVRTAVVDPQLLELLRVRPLLGRPFTAADAAPGAPAISLLGHDTWRGRFGSDPSIVGQTIRLDGTAVEVVGVMPEGFAFPDDQVDLYRPMRSAPQPQFGAFGVGAIARLAPETTVEAAQSRLSALLPRLDDYFPGLGAGFAESMSFAVTVATLRDRMVVDVASTLWITMGAVALVFLIACANVANLFLVRAESRQKEMAVRAALGAGRGSLAVSFLAESLLLGVGGGLVGTVLASGGVRALLAATELPRSSEVSVGASSLALAAGLSIVAGLAFGAMPMTRYAGRRFATILREGGRGSTSGRERHRARHALIASQLALGLVLLVGSGLMLRSFVELRAVDLGIEPDGVLTMALNRNAGEDAALAARFYQDAADRVSALPGVEEVGIATRLPLAADAEDGGSFHIESRPREEGEIPPVAHHRAVGPSYFTSLGIPLVAGRGVERADWEERRPVVWVNETMARTYFGGDAIGERITWDPEGEEPSDATAWAEIVGVVGDVRELGITNDEARPYAYLPLLVDGPATIDIETVYLTIELADGMDPMAAAPGVRAAIQELDGGMPITATRTMSSIVDAAMRSTSVTMTVLAIATVMALFLAAIGLAGVISYVVGERTREIGVRLALGASAETVRRMILRQSMVLTAAGVALGLAGALGLTGLMDALLFGVSTTDPLTFLIAPVVLVTVSLIATWLPLSRATRIDPTEALRAE